MTRHNGVSRPAERSRSPGEQGYGGVVRGFKLSWRAFFRPVFTFLERISAPTGVPAVSTVGGRPYIFQETSFVVAGSTLTGNYSAPCRYYFTEGIENLYPHHLTDVFSTVLAHFSLGARNLWLTRKRASNPLHERKRDPELVSTRAARNISGNWIKRIMTRNNAAGARIGAVSKKPYSLTTRTLSSGRRIAFTFQVRTR